MNKIILAIVGVLLIVVGGFYILKEQDVTTTPVAVSEDTSQIAQNIQTEVTPKEICFYKETKVPGSTEVDKDFTSIVYDSSSKVHGIMNWIPVEKDSLVGTYTGTVTDSGIPDYPWKISLLYRGIGEGVVSFQEGVIIVGDAGLKTGYGERYLDRDGTFKWKDVQKQSYDNPIPVVDCSSVPEQVKADYSNVVE